MHLSKYVKDAKLDAESDVLKMVEEIFGPSLRVGTGGGRGKGGGGLGGGRKRGAGH